MKLRKKTIFILNIFFAFFFVRQVFAATLELTPANSTFSIGGKQKIDLILNVTAGENVWGYDVYIKFPSANLTYNSSEFVAGSIFAVGGKTFSTISGDLISVGGYFDSSLKGVTTGGTVATLSFTGSSAGSGQIEIVCSQFTKIYSSGANQTNLFTGCASLLPKANFVVSASGASPGATSTPVPTSTLAPTSVPGAAGTATPTGGAGTQLTQLPETGTFGDILRLIYLGGGMILVGGLLSFGFTRIKRK